MLDIKAIREQPDWVRQSLKTRGGGDESRLDELIALDQRRRDLLTRVEELKSQRNRASKEIGQLIAQQKTEEAEKKKAETRSIGEEIGELDRQVTETDTARDELLLQFPNLPNSSVPQGAGEEENVVVRKQGSLPTFDFAPQPHTDLCQQLGLIDFNRATKLAGSGFLLFQHEGARLQRALIQFLLDLHTDRHGYQEIQPPLLVNRETMTGVGQFPKFADQVYTVQEGEDTSTLGSFYLIPTAEAPLVNIHRDEILQGDQLPIAYCAYTPCFRAEAGAAGVGTRGMIRVHQFDKVELVKITHPDDSYPALEQMVEEAARVLELLELHYRVIELCTGDLGFASAKTYDIEVWAPGQDQFLEVSSCSNCETFQSRRMNLRFKQGQGGGNQFPHTLNGSGTALARLFVALLETHQQSDGSVRIPEALQSYLKKDRLTVPS